MNSQVGPGILAMVLSSSASALAQVETAGDQYASPLAANDSASTPAPTSAAGTTSTSKLRRISLGLRLGYGVPMGSATGGGDAKLSDVVAGQIPIQLDLGYMVIQNLMLGVYGQYAFGVLANELSDGCDALGTACSVSGMRLGIQGQYHFLPNARTDPWVGLAIGYEWNRLGEAAAGVDVIYRGFEFATLQGGVDFNVRQALGIGPFVSLSLGQYSSVSSDDQDVRETAIHEWVTLGVRGTLGL